MTTGMAEWVESFANPPLPPSSLFARNIAPSRRCPAAAAISAGNSWRRSPGQGNRGQDPSRPQCSREHGKCFLQRHVVQCADREDRVVVLAGQWAGQDVYENTGDVAGRAALRLLDHLRGAIEGVDLLTSPGKLGCEPSGTAADIEHSPAARRQLTEQQPVVIRVMIPVEHSPTLRPLQAEPLVLTVWRHPRGHSRLINSRSCPTWATFEPNHLWRWLTCGFAFSDR